MNNNIETVEKTIGIALFEARQSIIKAIQNTGLHISLIVPIIRDLYNDLSEKETMQLEREIAEYQKRLSEQQNLNEQSNTDKEPTE